MTTRRRLALVAIAAGLALSGWAATPIDLAAATVLFAGGALALAVALFGRDPGLAW